MATELWAGYFDQFWAAWLAINPTAHLDALTYHGYPHNLVGNPYTGDINSPEVVAGACNPGNVIAGYLACVKEAITRNGLPADTPIWDTEGSWGNGASIGGFTSAQEVAFIGRFELLSWSAGATRQNWYQWDSQQWGTMCTGDPPCTPNANSIAYGQVVNWMLGSSMTSLCSTSGTVWTCGSDFSQWRFSFGGVGYCWKFQLHSPRRLYPVQGLSGRHYRNKRSNHNRHSAFAAAVHYCPLSQPLKRLIRHNRSGTHWLCNWMLQVGLTAIC